MYDRRNRFQVIGKLNLRTDNTILSSTISRAIRLGCSVFQLIGVRNVIDQLTLRTNVAVLIGRGDSCDVRLNDLSASRVHCRVIAHDGRVTLYDAGSRWGTFVNGQRISECDLKPGDRIRIGETTLQLTLDIDTSQQSSLSELSKSRSAKLSNITFDL